jgi:hypothetical protein
MSEKTLKDYVFSADENVISRFPELRFERCAFQDWSAEVAPMIEFLRDCGFEQEQINDISNSVDDLLEIILCWYERWFKQTGKRWDEMEQFLDDYANPFCRKEPRERKSSPPEVDGWTDKDYLTFPSLHFARTDYGEWSADKEALVAFLKAGKFSDERIREITGSEIKSLDLINIWHAIYYKLSRNQCEALVKVLEERGIPRISPIFYQ